jgi:hypothetical protein
LEKSDVLLACTVTVITAQIKSDFLRRKCKMYHAMKTRVISLLLVVVLIIGMLPMSVFATETGEETVVETAVVKFDAKRFAVSRPDPQENTKATLSADAKKFLGKTGRIDPTKDIVKKYAKIAAGDAKTNLGKAENIYNWIIANLERLDIVSVDS